MMGVRAPPSLTSEISALAGVTSSRRVMTLAGSPVPFTATGENLGPVTVMVDMMNIAFVAPGGGDQVTILLGDAVQWTNQDSGINHTATSNTMPAGGASFDSGFLSMCQLFTFTPGVQGTWVYRCNVHPAIMVDAEIIVQ